MYPESENNPEQSEASQGPDLNSSCFSYMPEGLGSTADSQNSNFVELGNFVVDKLAEKYRTYMRTLEAGEIRPHHLADCEIIEDMLKNFSILCAHYQPTQIISAKQLVLDTLQSNVTAEEDYIALVEARYGMQSVIMDLRRNPDQKLHIFFEEMRAPAYHLLSTGPEEDSAMDIVALYSEAALEELVSHLSRVKDYLASRQSTHGLDYTDVPVASRVFSLSMNDVLDYNDRRNGLKKDTELVVSDILDVNFWKKDEGYQVHLKVEVTEQSTGNAGGQAGVPVNKNIEHHFFSVGLGRVGELIIMREGVDIQEQQ